MKADKTRRPGFYWVRFEGEVIVAEYGHTKRRGGFWRVPGSAREFEDAEVCERLSDRLSLPTVELASPHPAILPANSPHPAIVDPPSLAGPFIVEHEGILVVRDDYYPGGTKARCLADILDLNRGEYVYASPVCGYAQVALAIVAKKLGRKATIFCAKRTVRHKLTLLAEAEGAEIREVNPGYMTVARKRALDYCSATGAQLLPFGLDDPAFITALAGVARSLDIKPTEVWAVAGSGVLIRALQKAWPTARFFGVRVGAEPNVGYAEVLNAAEKFEEPAIELPPFPSCSNYDAKAWWFIKRYATPGALFWNVAG